MDFGSIMGMAGGVMGGGAKAAPQYQAPQQSDDLQRLQEIAQQNQARGLQAPAVQMARQTPAYSFQYRNPSAPGAAPGQQFGVMAQDLERTPAGRSVVHEDEGGTKYINTPRLTMQNTAAIGELANKLDSLEQLRSMGK